MSCRASATSVGRWSQRLGIDALGDLSGAEVSIHEPVVVPAEA